MRFKNQFKRVTDEISSSDSKQTRVVQIIIRDDFLDSNTVSGRVVELINGD